MEPQQAPSTWHWARASARDLNIHGRTGCCRQPATRSIRGSGDVRGCIGRARRPIAPSQPSRPLKPTAMDSDPSEPGVSTETTNRRMSGDRSGPLSDKTDGTTATPEWPTPAYRQESVLIRRLFLFQVSATPIPSLPGLAGRGQSLRYRLDRWPPLQDHVSKLPVLHSP